MGGSRSRVGVSLDIRRHLESVLEMTTANDAKPSKTLEGIAKMKVPRSRNLQKIVKISIERHSFGGIFDEEPPTSVPN